MIRAIVVAALLVLATPAVGQTPIQVYPMGDYGTVAVAAPAPSAQPSSQIAASQSSGTPATINLSGLINALLPLVQSVVGALITVAAGWLAWLIKRQFGVSLDAGMRGALETALKNQASALIARGAVVVKDKQFEVDSAALARSVDIIANKAVPGAVKHFKLTPDAIRAKVLDAIPQAPAGVAIIAAAHAPAAQPS